MGRRVVITGLGVVAGLGLDWREVWCGLLEGWSAIRRYDLEPSGTFPVRYFAPVERERLLQRFPLAEAGGGERRTVFALAAATEATQEAGLDHQHAGEGTAVVIGSGVPERDPWEMLAAREGDQASWNRLLANRRQLRLANGARHPGERLATRIAYYLGCMGPVMDLNTACTGSAHAIGTGFRMVRRGEAVQVLAGGADSVLNLPTMTGLYLLGAPSISEMYGERLCRPFDRGRSGLVAGEGAAMVVLEEETHARARGAEIYAELAGFGGSLDAFGATAPHPAGNGAVLAMQKALADARLEPSAIDCINAHGTSTPLNDPIETRAIKRVFAGTDRYRTIPVTANKSMLGHLIAAAGALELVATVLTVRDGVVPPTINLEEPDPQCDLDYVPGVARQMPVRYALANSFGFGGLNTSLIVRRYDG